MASQLIFAGSRITAALLNSIAPLGAIKAADQSVMSSTAMHNDTELFAPVVAGAAYLFTAYLEYTGGTLGSSDIQWQWSVPSGNLRYEADYTSTSGAFTGGLTILGITNVAAGTNGGALMGAKMSGTYVAATPGGILQLQWGQNTNNATPTVVKAQSSLALWRMS